VVTGKALFLLDIAALLAVWPVALRIAGIDTVPALLYPAANLISLYAMGLYRPEAATNLRRALQRLPLALGLGAMGATTAMLLLVSTFPVGAHQRYILPTALLGLAGATLLARLTLAGLRQAGLFRRRCVVIGAGRTAWDLTDLLGPDAIRRDYDLTFLHDPALGPPDPRLFDGYRDCIRSEPASRVLDIAQEVDAREIVMTPDSEATIAAEDLRACHDSRIAVRRWPSFVARETGRIDVPRLETIWPRHGPSPEPGGRGRRLKRALDLLIGLPLLLLFCPFLLAAAAAIKLDDGGPLLYRQTRVTRHGHLFRILKLRTMRPNAEPDGAVWAAHRDPRITRAGRILRRLRIDEMPQLWNVLRGDMSLVGPRPERPEFVAHLADCLPRYHERHAVKAGITGWAQINYPYAASIEEARTKLSYDLYYVRHASIFFDLLILLQTLRVVVWPSGAR
jgi:exopolysaccharide biosynthesis polyprenyl glycosylphosphotransferase